MTIIDKAVEWLRINKIGYFVLVDKDGQTVGRSEDTDVVKAFLMLTATLSTGIYTLHAQKDKNNSASKSFYTFSIAEEKTHSVGNVDVNTSLLEQLHLQKIQFMEKFHDLEVKQLKEKYKEKPADTDALSKISGILENAMKLTGNTATKPAVAAATPGVGNTDGNSEEKFATNLENIKDTLGSEQELMNVVAKLALRAKADPEAFKSLIKMI